MNCSALRSNPALPLAGRPRNRGAAVRVILCLLSASCADAATIPALDATVRRDSAGVEIVENPEFAPDSVAWTLDAVPRVTIGDDTRGDAYIFSRIVALQRFRDGRIVVADGGRGGPTVRVYDARGTHLQNVGRRGAGPGEYATIRDLYLLSGDTLVVASVYDEGPLIYYDAQGNHIRTIRRPTLPPDADLGRYSFINVLGAFDDGTLLFLRGWQPMWAASATRGLPPDEPRAYTDSAKLVRGKADSVPLAVYGVVPRERGVFYSQPFPRSGYHDQYIFAQPSFVVHGTRVFVAKGERFEVHEYAPDGRLLRIVRKRHTPVAIPAAWADSVTRANRAVFARHPEARWIVDAQLPEPPAVASAIDRLLVDDAGNLWVHSNQRGRSPGAPIWHVFDSTGVLLHALHADIPLVARIGRDNVLGVTTDSLGVPTVVEFHLQKR